METTTEMGKLTVDVEITNYRDEGKAEEGTIPWEKVRRATVNAIVDSGATMLVLPEDVIQRLGLPPLRTARSRLADGRVLSRTVYGGAKIKVLNRVVEVEALSAPAGVSALLGQVPMELLDFIIDLKNRRLLPNPESPDPEMALVDLL